MNFQKRILLNLVLITCFASISCDVKQEDKSIDKASKKGVYITIDPGKEGFSYEKDKPVEQIQIYTEGTYKVPSDKNFHIYNVLQKTKSYKSTVMDKNGTDITVNIAVNYAVEKGKIVNLHLKWGKRYISFVDDKSQGAIKEVIGRYSYEEIYSTKRDVLELEIDSILKLDFEGNFLTFNYVEITDVDLPPNIAQEIINLETQKLKILTAKEKVKEAEYLRKAKAEQDGLLDLNK